MCQTVRYILLYWSDWFILFLDANLKYGQGQGILIAVPLPEGVANSGGQVEDAIQLALTEAQ